VVCGAAGPGEQIMMEPGVSLLHNMSCSSTTVISHGGQGLKIMKQIVFLLPPGGGLTTAEDILKRITGERKKRANAAQELRRILNDHAVDLPYPAGTLVQTQGIDPKASNETNLLTICTVLSKSSDRLYLRDKEPNLSGIRSRRRIALLIPRAKA
jgi:hypothetical protein